VLYILTAADTIGIIRSTVSITFIINLDEMFYNACAPATMKKSIADTVYEIKHSRLWYGCAAPAAAAEPRALPRGACHVRPTASGQRLLHLAALACARRFSSLLRRARRAVRRYVCARASTCG